MHEKTEMRLVMAKCVEEAMRDDPDIVVIDADLARANGNLELHGRRPDRCLNVGVAEANMASVAAGLASYGFKPFIYSFAVFASRRICDQVAISIAYAGQNVKIVGTDPGLAAGFNGGTHMTLEDIGVMRSIPGLVIFEPTDGDQLAKAFPAILAHDGPMYIRLYRKPAPATYFADDAYDFDLFRADIMRRGRDVSLFAAGMEVKEAMDAAAILARDGIEAEVVNVHTIKPLDEGTVLASVARTGCAVVCENHNVLGGLGSAVAETLAAGGPAPVEFIGMRDVFSEVGVTSYLVKKYGMDSESVAAAARRAMARKGRAVRIPAGA